MSLVRLYIPIVDATALFIYLFIFMYLLFIFLLFGATLVAYGSFQARGQTGATAACLRHSHSNAGSELPL